MATELATRLMATHEWHVRHPDARVARLAAAQRGAIHRDQLLVVGVGAGAIKHRVATGRLHPLHRSVFAVGRADLEPLGREVAALLACGRGAVLTAHSAAFVWGFGEPPQGDVHVNLPRGAGRTRRGVIVRREAVHADEIRVNEHLRLMSPARTLLSLADAVDLTELERMVGTAARSRLVTERELRETLERHRGHRGISRLREVVDQGPRFTRSEAERRFLAIVRRSGLPQPRVNARVAGHEVDFVWPAARLVVEVDGYAFHASRSAVEHDRRREADLDAAGFDVLRLTWRQITTGPEAVLVRLARRLYSSMP